MGKAILLHSEQGFGDTIQFCRYVPLVAERGARVIFEVPRPLRELMSTLTGVSKSYPAAILLPDFDTHCPLLSLPLAFGTQLETIPRCNALSARVITVLDELGYTAGAQTSP